MSSITSSLAFGLFNATVRPWGVGSLPPSVAEVPAAVPVPAAWAGLQGSTLLLDGL